VNFTIKWIIEFHPIRLQELSSPHRYSNLDLNVLGCLLYTLGMRLIHCLFLCILSTVYTSCSISFSTSNCKHTPLCVSLTNWFIYFNMTMQYFYLLTLINAVQIILLMLDMRCCCFSKFSLNSTNTDGTPISSDSSCMSFPNPTKVFAL
jgi:hypothetical protein